MQKLSTYNERDVKDCAHGRQVGSIEYVQANTLAKLPSTQEAYAEPFSKVYAISPVKMASSKPDASECRGPTTKRKSSAT